MKVQMVCSLFGFWRQIRVKTGGSLDKNLVAKPNFMSITNLLKPYHNSSSTTGILRITCVSIYWAWIGQERQQFSKYRNCSCASKDLVDGMNCNTFVYVEAFFKDG
eukprot:scaffold17093_cov179-Skeletonema_marinoi.AAC.2